LNIKTITASTMADALALVRRQFGVDAVVLHTRTYRRGGIMGLGARAVVEVTAADGRELGRARRRRATPTVGTTRPVTKTSWTAKRGTSAPPRDTDGAAGDLIRRTYAAAHEEMAQQQAETPVSPSGQMAHDAEQLADEMRAVKRMVARMMNRQQMRHGPDTATKDVPDVLFDQYLAMLKQEVAEELAAEIVEQVRADLNEDEIHDSDLVQRALSTHIADLVPTEDHTIGGTTTDDGRPRTIMLIGPTGVGKTTTIAKLAANFKLKQKCSVSLVTLDTYRIAAVDQLQTYADILGVTLHVVTNPQEMLEVDARCRSSQVVLIDTAGRSQRDDPKLEQLASFVKAARPHEVHLVLSATCTQKVLLDTVERFSIIPIDRIIFTKLDEAVSFGVLLNVVRKVNKCLSYVTTGQEVPHQIEPGRADRLAALVLGHQSVGAVGSEQARNEAR